MTSPDRPKAFLFWSAGIFGENLMTAIISRTPPWVMSGIVFSTAHWSCLLTSLIGVYITAIQSVLGGTPAAVGLFHWRQISSFATRVWVFCLTGLINVLVCKTAFKVLLFLLLSELECIVSIQKNMRSIHCFLQFALSAMNRDSAGLH